MRKQLLILILLLSVASNIFAEQAKIGNLWYNLYGTTATVIQSQDGVLYSGNIVIPNNVNYNYKDYTVTTIGESAFESCSDLTSITIPNSIKSIGYRAFNNSGWYNNQPDGILYLDKWLICYKGNKPVGDFTIKDGTKGLASGALAGCDDLTSITIPNSVTIIGSFAFDDCSGLTSITIPNSITQIESICFGGCYSLASVTIPNSVTYIGSYAFSDCRSLTSIVIPESVMVMADNTFSGCSSLASIVVEGGNTFFDSRNDCNAIIETSTNKLKVGCKNTTIPNNVTSIGEGAFSECDGLTSLTIPNSVTRE